MQNWYQPNPYGVYPRGNATDPRDIVCRFGTLSILQQATQRDDKEQTELPYLELMQYLLGFLEVPDLCRLSRTCTGFYVITHCTEVFKTAYTFLSPRYLQFRRHWKETAVRGYLKATGSVANPPAKKTRAEGGQPRISFPDVAHRPVRVGRAYYSDHLFQAWMCTILPAYYHLRPVQSSSESEKLETPAACTSAQGCSTSPLQYTSAFKSVSRCRNLSVDEFRTRFEEPNLPVVLTDVVTEWPLFKIMEGTFTNLADRRPQLVQSDSALDAPMRCEYTSMNLADYVRYATEQSDERPIYMFDAEFGSVLDAEKLYTVPEYFGRDDFFSVLGDSRPKYRWIIAGPRRGGSSFHVDPNYTNAWNANITGRKRWILFPPGSAPPGVVPSEDMSEVATPVSLTEWLLNFYDASVEQLRHVGYECICEPGDIMFVPCGWWHYVINLEDSLAITQNYVSECNLIHVVKFLRSMKSSISGINEDADDAVTARTERRQESLADEFVSAMEKQHPVVMRRVETRLQKEHEEREKRRIGHLTMLADNSEGFKFEF